MLKLGGVKGSQGGREYGRGLLLKSSIMANESLFCLVCVFDFEVTRGASVNIQAQKVCDWKSLRTSATESWPASRFCSQHHFSLPYPVMQCDVTTLLSVVWILDNAYAQEENMLKNACGIMRRQLLFQRDFLPFLSSLALAWNERFEWGVSPTPLRLLAFYNNDYSHCINNVLCCLPQRNNNRNQSERSPSAANWRSQDQGPLPPAAARQGDSSAQMSSARMRKWPQPDLPCWFSAHEMDCRDSPGCNCSEDTCETWGWGGGCIDLVAGTLRVAPKPWQ